MIKIENKEINDTTFKCTYSTTGMYIQKVNTQEFYTEAYDVLGSSFEYTETTEKISSELVSDSCLGDRMDIVETKVDTQEGAINDLLISVIPEFLGGV